MWYLVCTSFTLITTALELHKLADPVQSIKPDDHFSPALFEMIYRASRASIEARTSKSLLVSVSYFISTYWISHL